MNASITISASDHLGRKVEVTVHAHANQHSGSIKPDAIEAFNAAAKAACLGTGAPVTITETSAK